LLKIYDFAIILLHPIAIADYFGVVHNQIDDFSQKLVSFAGLVERSGTSGLIRLFDSF
jgi:hypothetical protein